jgi:hypothetical protein
MKKLKLVFALYKDLGEIDGKQALLPVTEPGSYFDLITVYVKDPMTKEMRYVKDYTNNNFPGKALYQAKEFVSDVNKQLQELYDFHDRIYAFKNALQALSGDFGSDHPIIEELINNTKKALGNHLPGLNLDTRYWYGMILEQLELKIETIAFWNPSFSTQKDIEIQALIKNA